MGRPDPDNPHDGIEKVGYEEFPENAVGRVAYQHRLDPSEFRKDRDFAVEWVDGPVRFILKRDDHGDYWTLASEPAGSTVRMKTGYEKDSFSGSTSGGMDRGSTVISPTNDEYQESFGVGDIIFTKTYVDLSANPFTLDTDFERDVEGLIGFTQGAKAAVKTSGGYSVTQDMVEAQLRALARHAAQAGREGLTVERLKRRLKSIREFPHDSSQVYQSPWLRELYDTAYVLGLREDTAHAASCHGADYPSVPDHYGEDKFGPIAQKADELMWKLGKRDKPYHIKEQERAEKHRQRRENQERAQRQAPPPTPPENRDVSDKNNTCPECEGRYHKADLTEHDYDRNYSSGTVWRCPDCESIVAGDLSYHGPEPTPRQTRRRGF